MVVTHKLLKNQTQLVQVVRAMNLLGLLFGTGKGR